MLLYHFTSREHMERILQEGLKKGDAPLRPRPPLCETNAVWLTEIPEPSAAG